MDRTKKTAAGHLQQGRECGQVSTIIGKSNRSRGDLGSDPGRQGGALLTIAAAAVDKVPATRISRKLYPEYNNISAVGDLIRQ